MAYQPRPNYDSRSPVADQDVSIIPFIKHLAALLHERPTLIHPEPFYGKWHPLEGAFYETRWLANPTCGLSIRSVSLPHSRSSASAVRLRNRKIYRRKRWLRGLIRSTLLS